MLHVRESHPSLKLIAILIDIVSFSEPFLESIPQVLITMTYMMEKAIDENGFTQFVQIWLEDTKTLFNFSISVLSASFGISNLLKIGPCRLVPYDKIDFGFFLLILNIATAIIGKGIVFASSLIHITNNDSEAILVIKWISICIFPHIFFVST